MWRPLPGTEDKKLYAMVPEKDKLVYAPANKPHTGGYYRKEFWGDRFKLEDPPKKCPVMELNEPCQDGRALYYLDDADGRWKRLTGQLTPGIAAACWKETDPKPTSSCSPIVVNGSSADDYLYGMVADAASGRLKWAKKDPSYKGPYYSRRFIGQPYAQ
jgi:hypothetical protein